MTFLDVALAAFLTLNFTIAYPASAESVDQPEVLFFPTDSSEAADAPYTVTVNGTKIPLERVGSPGGRDNQVYYARFCGVGECVVTVTVAGEGKIDARVEPERLVRQFSVKDSKITFTAKEAGPRVVRIRTNGTDMPRLLVIMEPEEEHVPDPSTDRVSNILDYGVEEGPEPQTARIQKALDECTASPGTGYVVVPPGRYVTGTLRVRDNTILYLAPGAMLAASSDPNDFPVDPGRREEGTHGRTHSFSRVILFDNAENSGLIGRGTIDGNGQNLRNRHHRAVQIIDAHNCSNLTIDGVVLRHPASWTCHLVHSTNVQVRNLKVITDWDVGNADGINPDMCQNVLMERVFCYTGDDSIAVKATHVSDYLQPTTNVHIRDSVVMTFKTALKIGTETYADVRNVIFENIDVVYSSRGIAMWVRDGGKVSNITYRNIRMDLAEMPGESRSGQPFYLYLCKRHGEGSTLSDVVIRDIRCSAPWYSFIDSCDPTPIERVTFDNVELTVRPRAGKKDRKFLFEFNNAREIVFRNLTVDWTEADPEQWQGLWPDDAPLEADNVVQKGINPQD